MSVFNQKKKREKEKKNNVDDDDWEELGKILEASENKGLGNKIAKGVKSVRKTLEKRREKKAKNMLKDFEEAFG